MKKTLPALAACLWCCIAPAQDFNEHFIDKTIRADYIFSGNAEKQDISLDELSALPQWAGRRTRLDELPLAGNGEIEMKDAASGAVIYRTSFSSLFQEWICEKEAKRTKRSFENISVSKELTMLRKKYQRPSPNFFAEVDESRSKQHAFYHTAMDDLYALVNKVHFRKGREQYGDYCPISSSLAYNMASGNATEYRHKDKIVQIIDESKAAINRLYLSIRTADEQEREVLYEQITDIKAERDRQVTKWLTNENVLILVLRHYEKNSAADWRIYAAFINHPIFSELLWELYDGTAKEVTEDENGEYSLYGRKFAKKYKKMRMK